MAFMIKAHGIAASHGRARRGLWGMISKIIRLSHQRRALSTLSDAQLSDIGLSRDEAQAEARRPFWDAPENWMD